MKGEEGIAVMQPGAMQGERKRSERRGGSLTLYVPQTHSITLPLADLAFASILESMPVFLHGGRERAVPWRGEAAAPLLHTAVLQ